jgi:hypothetical protein
MEGHQDRERWERDLNRFYFACGCSAGAKGLVLGLLAGAVAGVAAVAGGWSGPAGGVALAGGAVVTGALLGKLAGLAQAERQLRATVAAIQASVRDREPGRAEAQHCG